MNINISTNNFGNFTARKPVKIENAAEMKELASDIIRMANCDHPMLVDTYEKFVESGIKCPTYAQLILKNAEYDAYYKSAEAFVAGNITREEHLQRFKNTRGALGMLDKSFLGSKLYDAMSQQAIDGIDVPKTDVKAYKQAVKKAKSYVQKKIAVLAGLSETSSQLVPCSVNKGVKKVTYRFLRLLNK